MKGSLTIVGSGIRVIGDLTHDAINIIKNAEQVFFIVADPATNVWIHRMNPNSESLRDLYAEGKHRQTTYNEMVDKILTAVRAGQKVCAVFYGHPGVFVGPSHEAIKRCREEGFSARMMPGISAEDWLFADLGIDPARCGCHSFEATDFLIRRRGFDPRSSLILWQVGVIGHLDFHAKGYEPKGVQTLVDVLKEFYPPEHLVTVYEAAQYPICEPRMEAVALQALPSLKLGAISTLYVPALEQTPVDAEMMARLGLDKESF